MIVYAYLNKRHRERNANIISVSIASFMFAYTLVFCLAAFGSKQIVQKYYGIVEFSYEIKYFKGILNWIIVAIQFLQIPFKFYLGKEYVFILIDELQN